MFDFEKENNSAKLLFVGSSVGGIAVAWNDNLLFLSVWPWAAFCLLAYMAEAEDIAIYRRKKSLNWFQAMVFRANDDGNGKIIAHDTFSTRIEALFYFSITPIYRGYQAIILAALVALIASIVMAVATFVLTFLSILPSNQF